MKLYLIRHAQTPANVRKALDTALPGPPLTELGEQQAQRLADELAERPIRAVYASYATRAQQTAAPLAAACGVEVQVVEGVHEVTVGDLEGRTDEKAIHTYISIAHRWAQGELDAAMPGGESGRQVRERFVEAVAQIRAKHEQSDPDGIIALVSHGGVLRLGAEWICDNVRPEVADAGLLPNTGLIELDSRPDGWHCVSWAGTAM
ncbi:histidine phosphatase family protein [Amycolatopsis suaedae]|uniref:Histidine phosphatase family protein n=1 Tax=Amycolatopsis suaedae TaxID=2510978 RepID=A0A4Q7J5G3_9PSEU|nr:histidine phosphatase family protein [Amycolatopsis suaedae]RZQ62088.1 histidine phosphatase family protein [Amycolatopsis suaedae]